MNGQNRKNSISRLVIEGEMVEDLDRIKEKTIRFYASLYSRKEGLCPVIENLFSKSLGSVEAESLEMAFLEEEIKEAIFGMTKDKSFRPDGFPIVFYQECWDFIKYDLLKVFEEFFVSSIINLGVKAMFFVLILKKGVAELSIWSLASIKLLLRSCLNGYERLWRRWWIPPKVLL